MKTSFHVVPALRCHCPAKSFRKAGQALKYARKASVVFRVAYAVWRVRKGTLRLLRRFRPPMSRFGPDNDTERRRGVDPTTSQTGEISWSELPFTDGLSNSRSASCAWVER
jgi:hypothetical protein